ncbi:MAG: S41 family peptidase [Cyclobacteriaceae bacterium]
MKHFINHPIFFKKIFLLWIVIVSVYHAKGQNFENLDFDHSLQENQINAWLFKNETTQAIIDTASSNKSLKISKSENWKKNFYQDQKITPDQLAVYRLSGRIKVENLNGKHDVAYLTVQFYGADSMLLNAATNRSQGFKNTQDWKTGTVECIAPINAVRMRIGGGVQGGGTVWFDDFAIEKYILDTSSVEMSDVAEEYLKSVVEIMKNQALHRKHLDFGSIHQILRSQLDNAQTVEDTHPIIDRYAPVLLADGHSQLTPAKSVKQLLGLDTLDVEKLKKDILQHIEPHRVDSLKETIHYSEGKLIDGKVGYLIIPPFEGLYWEALELYADSLQRIIEHLDQPSLKGWIVDLRKNWGGVNMPMIAGIGPILNNENAYYYIKPNNEVFTKNYYKKGVFYEVDKGNGNTLTLQVKNSYRVNNKNLPVAILTNHVTSSAGEAVLASFIGQKNVKSFGSTTGGAITGNAAVFLDDGSLFHISAAYLADRNKKVYHSGIAPDVQVKFDGKVGEDLNNDPVIQEAKKWINER